MRQRAQFSNVSLEAIEATLNLNFVPEGWLDPLTPPKKKLKLSLNKKKIKSNLFSVQELFTPFASSFNSSSENGAANLELLAFAVGSSLDQGRLGFFLLSDGLSFNNLVLLVLY